MAIVKTNPAPPMTVGHYRDAALRHFNTCKVLWRYVNIPHTSNLKNINEDLILKNVFYLSGYVVECALKYRYCTDCYGWLDTKVESTWVVSPPLKGLRNHFTQFGSDKAWSESILQSLSSASAGHNIPNYLKKMNGVPSPSLILNPDEAILYDMQESWLPTIRYHFEANGLIVNRADIEAFYESTRILLRDLKIK